MQLRSLDLFEQHGRNDRIPVLRAQRQVGNQVGLRGEKMYRRTQFAQMRVRHGDLLSRVNDRAIVRCLRHENAAQITQRTKSEMPTATTTASPWPDLTWK